jgi:hypothetical protein
VRRRRGPLFAIAIVLALALLVGGCGGGDGKDDNTTATPPASETPFGGQGTAPQSDPGQLPPEFVECMVDQGFDIESSADIHSAPPQVLQACFGSLHGGGP